MNRNQPYHRDPPSRVRTRLVCVGFMVGFSVILVRLLFLQVLGAESATGRATQQHHRLVDVAPLRGNIVDRAGSPLALIMEKPVLYGNPTAIQNPDRVAKRLATILGEPVARISALLKQPRTLVWVKSQLSASEVEAIRAMGVEGLHIRMEPQRVYPKSPFLSHLLGFVGVDGRGLEGLEFQYDALLRGERQRVEFDRDGLGHMISLRGAHRRLPPQGFRLTLTIDEVIQYIAEQELETAVKRARAKRGIALVMDPATGAMLAWAVHPTFDSNNIAGLTAASWRNRAITDPYEPGSTLKAVVAAAAVEEQLMTPEAMVYCGEGEMTVAGTVVRDPANLGWVRFAEAFARSSNVAMIKIADMLGPQRLSEYLKKFGFGEKTGIDLPGESRGIFKPLDRWGKRTLASMAIGQEISVTPLQLLRAISAIANGGWVMTPFVVAQVTDSRGQPVSWSRMLDKRMVISHDTSQTITTMLEEVVRQGTGKQASLNDYPVAGKTGTAQMYDPAMGRYSSSKVVASFVGFVPAHDPRLAILVVIDEPRAGATGGVVAAPAFRHIAERALRHLQIAPVVPTLVRFREEPGSASMVSVH